MTFLRRKTTARIILHHSASNRSTTFDEIEAWHLQRGFQAIGYHYVIERGSVIPGRPDWAWGAHARGANFDSIGICLVGDNTDPQENWLPEQVLMARLLIRELGCKYPGLELYGHCDVGTTATLCPGLKRAQLLQMLISVGSV